MFRTVVMIATINRTHGLVILIVRCCCCSYTQLYHRRSPAISSQWSRGQKQV